MPELAQAFLFVEKDKIQTVEKSSDARKLHNG